MAQLTLTSPGGQTVTVHVEGNRATLGRSQDNDWSFPEDETLSRHHAVIEQRGERWWAADLQSKNGTFVNGERLRAPQALRPGDLITAGRVKLAFETKARDSVETVVFERVEPSLIATVTDLDSLLGQGQAGPLKAPESLWTAPAKALLRAGRELAYSRPLSELFTVILDLALEAVGASRGLVMTGEKGNLTVQASRGEGFRISTTIRNRVLLERASLLVEDTQAEASFREQASIISQKVRTFMAVPLQTDERVMGLLYVDTPVRNPSFSSDDLDLLTVMANIAAIQIERVRLAEVEEAERLLEAELLQAAEIQQRVLPATPPSMEGYEFAGYNAACRMVGGDCFDFFRRPDGQLKVLIADVAGKGMPAALLVMSLQAKVQAMGESEDSPATVLSRLNRGMVASSPGNRFATVFLGSLAPATGEFAYANAGHNPPLWLRGNGEITLLSDGGPILGILPAASYRDYWLELNPGDVLLMYSDGVTEASNAEGEEFGVERLQDVLKQHGGSSAETLLVAVREAVENWVADTPPEDDATVVVVRRTR